MVQYVHFVGGVFPVLQCYSVWLTIWLCSKVAEPAMSHFLHGLLCRSLVLTFGKGTWGLGGARTYQVCWAVPGVKRGLALAWPSLHSVHIMCCWVHLVMGLGEEFWLEGWKVLTQKSADSFGGLCLPANRMAMGWWQVWFEGFVLLWAWRGHNWPCLDHVVCCGH